MTTAVKLWADQPPLEFPPAVEGPVKDSKLLNIITQVRQVFGSESFP